MTGLKMGLQHGSRRPDPGWGLGWLMGKHGLSVDNLLSADVVTPDGQFRRASATENPELFWGLRGGDGNFAMGTSLEFRLHAVGRVPASDTAFGLRAEQWDLNVVSQCPDPADSARQTEWTRQFWARIEPHMSGGASVNHLAADDRPEKVRASYGANYDRLVALKRTVDPTNMLRLNAKISPR